MTHVILVYAGRDPGPDAAGRLHSLFVHDGDLSTGLRALDRTRGSAARTLRIGDWRIALEGLDAPLASCLDRRWGGFVEPESSDRKHLLLRVLRATTRAWLEPAGAGEPYRIEVLEEGRRPPLVYSYHFAIWGDEAPGVYRCALAEQDDEPSERAIENAVRCLMTRAAAEDGGFALHAAGVLDGGRAYLFAGPSRAGKTTAIGLLAPRPSLGDDFAVVLPGRDGWRVPAVPFDNQERAPDAPPRGLYPAAGIWRLFQDETSHVETVPPALAVASLMGCVALPWTIPDLAQSLLEQVRRFVAESRFAHLHFRRSSDFWALLRTETS